MTRPKLVRTWKYGTKTGSVRATMGGGDDWLWVNDTQQLEATGGGGRDGLYYRVDGSTRGPVNMDLRAGTVVSGEGTVMSRYDSFENAHLVGPFGSRLIGTYGDNWLQSCGGRILGLGGNDHITASSWLRRCPSRSGSGVAMYGGPGDDDLRGGPHADRLVGGPGHDIAMGGSGTDLCLAEQRRSCERA